MKESAKLEDAVLDFLVEKDTYNAGLPEGDFLVSFSKEHKDLLDEVAGDVLFPRNILVAHLLLMAQRGYINYGTVTSATGKIVGPVKPAGYDRQADSVD